jgi:hypothetical protein
LNRTATICGLAWLGAVAACSSGGGDGAREAAAAVPGSNHQPRLTFVALDHSMSRTPAQTEGDSALLALLVSTLDFGDRLVISEVHSNGRTDAARRWTTAMPHARAAGNPTPVEKDSLFKVRGAAMRAANTLLHGERYKATDLFASLYDAADYASESHLAGVRLVMFSDMRQSTPSLDMERGDWRPGNWIAEHKSVLPRFPGGCVVVIGADISGPNAPAVKAFWTDYFEATGARLADYRYVATDVGMEGC